MNEQTKVSLVQREYSEAAKKALARSPSLFINNEWVGSSHDRTLAVVDPSNGKEVSRIVDASDKDVDRAVAAARQAFDDGRWSDLPPMVRESMMHKLTDLLGAHTEELAELEAIDNGKPIGIARVVDVPAAMGIMRYMAGWPSKLGGEFIEPMTSPRGAFHSYVRREPVGVAALIVPWNFPLVMAMLKVAPALAAGCTVILKPAEQTSLTALRMADLIVEAGFPAGVINVITGLGETAGERLVLHPDVDKVGFTGSTAVGKMISRNSVDSLKRLTLELGGKSPVIVMPDVDIEHAGLGAAGAIFFNSGQVCTAGSRIYAHRSVFDKILEKVAEGASAWAPRPSLDPEGQNGPLVSEEQFNRVMGYLEEGKKAGASVAVGGDVPASEGGYYFNPTVLVDVKPEMSVVKEEIFGPVVVAQRFDDLDEVAKAANDTCFGLGASIWTKDIATVHKLAPKIRAGAIWGNCHGNVDPSMPFGGFKQSGVGREMGRAGVESYTELKSVLIQF